MKYSKSIKAFSFVLGLISFAMGCGSPSPRPLSERAPTSKPKRVLVPIPHSDFDPTEAAVPWTLLKAAGFEVVFATPDGQPGSADPAEVTGEGLGLLAKYIAADKYGRAAYEQLKNSEEFMRPVSWSQLNEKDFDAIYLPGGHSPGMQPYLRSEVLQKLITEFFAADKPVGAICHGALLVARSISPVTGKSVLFGRKTTSLTGFLEMTGYRVAQASGAENASHFRTDPETVQDQVIKALASAEDYQDGPKSLIRDEPTDLSRGFFVQDRNYISARWPGDAFRFGSQFVKLVSSYQPNVSAQVRFYYLPYRKGTMHVRVGESLPRQKPVGDILYLHGFADRLDNHGPLFEEWLNQGFRVIGFDMPSHGEDYGWGGLLNSFTIGGLEELARKVETVTQESKSRPLLLAGWSTGGLIAIRLVDPRQVAKMSRAPAGILLFAPGVSVKKLVGDHGVVTEETLTSNKNPPHEGPPKPKIPMLYPAFALSMLYNANLSQQVVKSVPRNIPILTFVAGTEEDHYVHAEKVKKWVLEARATKVPMSGLLCDHSHHELDNEPGAVGAEVRGIAARFATAVLQKAPAIGEITAQAKACTAF
jgi:protease I